MSKASTARVEVIRSPERFRELKASWDELYIKADESYPMLSHAWLLSWWNAFVNDRECHVVLVWRADVLVAAAPFVIAERNLFLRRRRVLTFFANTWVDRIHVLTTEPSPEIIGAIFDHFQRSTIRFDLIDLSPIDAAAPLTNTLLQTLIAMGWKIGAEEDRQSPYLSLPRTWEALLGSLSSSFRQTVRRKIRKVEGMPNVSMRVVRDESCIDAINEISLESWQNDEGTSMASTERIKDFFAPIIRDAAKSGALRCALLEVDGEPAAFEFNLVHRGTLHNFKLGFKKKYADLSSGIVLKAHILKEILDSRVDANVTEYDFMGVAEPYKLNWTKSIRYHNRYFIFPRRLEMSCLYWVFFVLKPWARERLPWLKTVRGLVTREKDATGAL